MLGLQTLPLGIHSPKSSPLFQIKGRVGTYCRNDLVDMPQVVS